MISKRYLFGSVYLSWIMQNLIIRQINKLIKYACQFKRNAIKAEAALMLKNNGEESKGSKRRAAENQFLQGYL